MIHSVPTMVARRVEKVRDRAKDAVEKAREEAPAPEQLPRDDENASGVGIGGLLRQAAADALEATALWLRSSSVRRVPGGHRGPDDGERVDFVRFAHEDDSGRNRRVAARKADDRYSRGR